MLGLCREKQVKKVIERLKAEYEAAFREQEAAIAKLKEENRVLKAHSLELEAERENVASALIRAEQEGGRIRAEAQRERENGAREAELLDAKCRALSRALLAKYPMEADVRAFAAFVGEAAPEAAPEEAALEEVASEEVVPEEVASEEVVPEEVHVPEEENTGFDLDEVISPKEPLDLEKLCRDLGLMEEEG